MAELRFDRQRFVRQMKVSEVARAGLIVVFFIGWVLWLIPPLTESGWPVGLMMLSIVGWLLANMISIQTGRLAQQAVAMNSGPVDPEALERVLRAGLQRFTLYSQVRVMLYHQLGLLRHRQSRFDASAAICQALLGEPSVKDRGMLRSHLLLMLAEAKLNLDDLTGAYAALAQLHDRRMHLQEALQLLGLQVRYETRCGYYREVLRDVRWKLSLIDLLPAAPAAMLHLQLATAAAGTGQPALAGWLQRRAELLWPNSEQTMEWPGPSEPADANGLVKPF